MDADDGSRRPVEIRYRALTGFGGVMPAVCHRSNRASPRLGTAVMVGITLVTSPLESQITPEVTLATSGHVHPPAGVATLGANAANLNAAAPVARVGEMTTETWTSAMRALGLAAAPIILATRRVEGQTVAGPGWANVIHQWTEDAGPYGSVLVKPIRNASMPAGEKPIERPIQRATQSLRTTAIGAAGGGLVGAIVGRLAGRRDTTVLVQRCVGQIDVIFGCTRSEEVEQREREYRTAPTVVGAAIGGIVGGLVGYLVGKGRVSSSARIAHGAAGWDIAALADGRVQVRLPLPAARAP